MHSSLSVNKSVVGFLFHTDQAPDSPSVKFYTSGKNSTVCFRSNTWVRGQRSNMILPVAYIQVNSEYAHI